QTPKHLNEAEQKLYDMVVRRFLAVFFPAAEYLQTTRITRVGEHPFRTEGKELINPGWPSISGRSAREESENLHPVKAGGSVAILELRVETTQTKPPGRFPEATLLSA